MPLPRSIAMLSGTTERSPRFLEGRTGVVESKYGDFGQSIHGSAPAVVRLPSQLNRQDAKDAKKKSPDRIDGFSNAGQNCCGLEQRTVCSGFGVEPQGIAPMFLDSLKAPLKISARMHLCASAPFCPPGLPLFLTRHHHRLSFCFLSALHRCQSTEAAEIPSRRSVHHVSLDFPVRSAVSSIQGSPSQEDGETACGRTGGSHHAVGFGSESAGV